MDFITENLLTILILLPLVGVVLTLADKMFWKQEGQLKWLTLGFTLVNFVVSLMLLADKGTASASSFYFEQNVPWIRAINTNYHVGVDGLSLWLVILTTFIMPIAVISTWHAVEKRQTAFYVFLLLLESAMIGVFVSLDLLVFYLFFEASLVPMFFLIGIWGGENRIYAAVKFFIFTALGSLLMLVAIIALYYIYADQTGLGGSFDFVAILSAMKSGTLTFVPQTGVLLFLAFALAFAIKVPLFPFHTWLPDAHTEAPTAGSVILAAVLLKMGTYGLMRFNFALFPDQSREFAWLFITLAIIGIIYGALVAMVQPDVKRLVAYSSVAHMGFVILGMFSFTEQGMQGALFTMLAHGVTTGALFLLVGFIYERRHTREITQFGGLANIMPVYATLFVITAMASVGLPFLNGFVGEFLIMVGMFKSQILSISAGMNWNVVATMLAGTGVIFAAVYLLWMVQRVFFGKVTNDKNKTLADLSWREIWLMIPLLFLMVYMGVYPKPILSRAKVQSKRYKPESWAKPAAASITPKITQQFRLKFLIEVVTPVMHVSMKIIFLFIFIFSGFISDMRAQTFYGTTDLKLFRDGRDKEFRDRKESPLKDEDFASFKGLNYYPVDNNFRLTATFTLTPSEKWFQMPTSSGTTRKFVKFGILEFKIDRKPYVLSVYQIDHEIVAKFPEYADLLFIPFKDLTNRKDTYGGGRYIDIQTPKGKTVMLDFNLAYNPNCAYGGEKWNCPIPPSENSLKISITAGEKRFAYTSAVKAQ